MKQQPIRDIDWSKARDIRRELGSETKDALLRAARSVFSAKGYDSATIGDITTTAEVARPTFYVYFATKAEIFQVVAATLRDEFLEAHHHPKPLADDPVLVSRASLAAFIGIYVDNLELFDEIKKRAQTDPQVANALEVMLGKPYRRTLRHINGVRHSGLAAPLVDEEYAARLMMAVSIDAASAIREEPARARFYIDQATRVYLAIIGFTGELGALNGDPSET